MRYHPRMTTAVPPAGTLFYRAVKALAAPPLRAYLRLRSEGEGSFPAAGGVILAANHESYLDPLVLAATCPRAVTYLMLRRFYEMPLVGWASRAAGSFPIDEGRIGTGALRRSLAVLGAGGVLGIFPEGRISPDGRLQPGRPGVARLALRTGALIVPARIAGTRRSFPKGRLLPRRSGVVVRYGEAIPVSAVAATGPEGRERALAALVMERIGALGAAG